MDDVFKDLGSKLAVKARQPDIHGYKPAPQQVRFHKCPKKQRIILGGNRSGKSYGSVVEMVWWATGTHPYRRTPRPPLALRHVAVDKPQGIDKVLKELYKKICPPEMLRGGTFDKAWAKEPPVLHFENGSTIEFLSYEQDLDKHAGTSRHAIAFDEEPDEAIFNENLARLIDTDGEWWIAMTPLEGLTWVYHNYYEPYEKGQLEEATELFIYNTDDNIYLPKGAFDRLMGNLSVEERNARRKGQFIALSGLIYPTFDHQYHVRELEPMKGMDNFTSMDHGLANATSWHWYQCDGDGVIYVQREHYESGLLVSDHAKAVKQMEASYPWLRPEYRVGDPSIQNRNAETGQSIQTAYADHGIFISLGNNDVDAGINRVAELFNTGRIFIDPSCRNLIRELRRYRWAEWASRKAATKNDAKNRPNKKDDHAVDDLRYGVMSRPLWDMGPGPQKVPVDFTKIVVPDIKYAEPEQPVDWRDGAYDDELGSEW
jgi:phage terminase large subunit-like protein